MESRDTVSDWEAEHRNDEGNNCYLHAYSGVVSPTSSSESEGQRFPNLTDLEGFRMRLKLVIMPIGCAVDDSFHISGECGKGRQFVPSSY